MTSKADYVRSQGQNRNHHCHWPGCNRQVPPAMWGCRPHWYQLPTVIRDRIWRTFKPGQEVSQTPSREYLDAARDAQHWIDAKLALPCRAQTGDQVDCRRCGKAPAEGCRWPHVEAEARLV
jgi:hypothetical protein